MFRRSGHPKNRRSLGNRLVNNRGLAGPLMRTTRRSHLLTAAWTGREARGKPKYSCVKSGETRFKGSRAVGPFPQPTAPNPNTPDPFRDHPHSVCISSSTLLKGTRLQIPKLESRLSLDRVNAGPLSPHKNRARLRGSDRWSGYFFHNCWIADLA